MLIQKLYVTGKMTNSGRRLNNMTSVTYNANKKMLLFNLKPIKVLVIAKTSTKSKQQVTVPLNTILMVVVKLPPL